MTLSKPIGWRSAYCHIATPSQVTAVKQQTDTAAQHATPFVAAKDTMTPGYQSQDKMVGH